MQMLLLLSSGLSVEIRKWVPLASFRLSGSPGGSDGKESASSAGDMSSILASGQYPGEGNGKLLQYSCLENCMDREPGRLTGNGVTKGWTSLSDYHSVTLEPWKVLTGSHLHKWTSPTKDVWQCASYVSQRSKENKFSQEIRITRKYSLER